MKICGNLYPSRRFKNLKGSAKRRGVEVNISIDDWKELMKNADNKCKYCSNDVQGETGGGLDRVDNSVGYVEGNLEVCCKICNNMKAGLSVDDFREHIVKICENI